MGLSTVIGLSVLLLLLIVLCGMLFQKALRTIMFQAPPENSIADMLPFLYVDADQQTMVLKDGAILQVIELEGIDFSTLSDGDEQRYFTLRKNLLNEFAQNPSLKAKLRFITLR